MIRSDAPRRWPRSLEHCVLEIRAIQQKARKRSSGRQSSGPSWPMIILRTPKGWTGPKEVDGHKVEGFWRAHQIPILDPQTNPKSLDQVEAWLRSYKPEELFDESGRLIEELRRDWRPKGTRRITANPHANGGLLRKPLRAAGLPRLCRRGEQAGTDRSLLHRDRAAHFLRDVMRQNMTSFRVFGPDETASNKLQAIYEASGKTWMADDAARGRRRRRSSPRRPRDGDAQRAHARRLVRRLRPDRPPRLLLLPTRPSCTSSTPCSTSTPSGWRRASWRLRWRAPISSINLLITSLVWRQDHNGFTHQDPGFLDVVTNKSPDVDAHLSSARCELPAECRPTIACAAPTTSTSSSPTRRRTCNTSTWKTPSSTAPKASASGTGPATTPGRAGRRHCLRGRYSDLRSAGRRRHPAGALPGSEDPLHQRRRSLSPDARDANIRTASPIASLTGCSPRTSRSSSTSTPMPR